MSVDTLRSMCWQLPTWKGKECSNGGSVPASLQRRTKEPTKAVHFQIPLSWWQELYDLGREFDQDVSTFLREAIEDWLQRARGLALPRKREVFTSQQTQRDPLAEMASLRRGAGHSGDRALI